MNLLRLVAKEIRLRKMNFALGTISVMIAVGVLVGQTTLMDCHDLRTRQILDAKMKNMEKEMAVMEDDYRKIMKQLGFNLLFLPEKQDLAEFHTNGYTTFDMPEEYVTRIANSDMVTINHVFPIVEEKTRWPEQGQRPIRLAGTRGEVPQKARDPMEPMMFAVAPGKAALGHELWNSLGLKIGDGITLLGKHFEVADVLPERGNRDDATIWLELSEAQELLNRKGRINSILALKCHCKGNSIAEIRKEVSGIVPGIQVIELDNMVTTRAQARDRAKETHLAAIKAEEKNRAEMRSEIEKLASWLLPIVTVGALAWISFLTMSNVRERASEIGILRAIGVGSRRIMTIFLVKSLLIGSIGALLGYFLGFALGLYSGGAGSGADLADIPIEPFTLGVVMIAAPFFASIAGLIPALIAAGQDPAIVLRNE